MPTLPRRKRPTKPDRRRALALLAVCRDGVTESAMRLHGFPVGLITELIRTGLATAYPERIVAGSRIMEVARVRITEAGRGVLKRTDDERS